MMVEVVERIVALVGATASGKTDLSIAAADACMAGGVKVEILALDSRQLYRGLDVGTGKPSAEQRERVEHHLLDRLDLDETPNAMRFREWAETSVREIVGRGAVPFLVGGSGFYLRALREGFFSIEGSDADRERVRREVASLSATELDTELRRVDATTDARLHPNDRFRRQRALEIARLSGRRPSDLEMEFQPQPILGAGFDVVHLQPPRSLLHERIESRTRHWMQSAWAEEVRALLDEGHAPKCPGLSILGYREVVAWITGTCSKDVARDRINVATRRYARSQETWFRKEDARWRGEAGGDRIVSELTAALVDAASA